MNTHQDVPIRILLVEDSPSHATLFKVFVGKGFSAKHEIVHVTNLKESFELLRRQSYDLVVLDLGLPDSYGLDTVDSFFSTMGINHPVIVLTASDEEGIGQDALRKGSIDFLVKGSYGADDLARSIRHALERWRQRNEIECAREHLKSFAHSAAHDLKSPLTSISAYASILQGNLNSDTIGKENKEYLDQVVFFSEHAEKLVNSLLNFSVLGERALTPSDINPNDVVRRSLLDLKTVLEDSKATIETGDLPSLNADPDLLTHVFQNLIGNGIKYRSKAPPIISISGTRNFDEVIISVKDNGIGIAEKFRDKVFEPFKRISSKTSSAGFGLGLAICQRIIQAHSGRIWVDATEKGGSNFSFSLPAAKRTPVTATKRASLHPALS